LYEESLSVRGAPSKVILTRKNRLIDPNGKYFLLGVIHDITERKEAEGKPRLAVSVFSHYQEAA
jgi:signal transduction histidine kinase